MRRIGDRQFLYAWQVIRAASQPGHEAMAWTIDDVWCRRYRHSMGCPDHNVTLDVYHVGHSEGRQGWRILICSENWWDDRMNAFRTHLWATHLAGPRERIMNWFKEASAKREKRI